MGKMVDFVMSYFIDRIRYFYLELNSLNLYNP